jgi:hypothetical protein
VLGQPVEADGFFLEVGGGGKGRGVHESGGYSAMKKSFV